MKKSQALAIAHANNLPVYLLLYRQQKHFGPCRVLDLDWREDRYEGRWLDHITVSYMDDDATEYAVLLSTDEIVTVSLLLSDYQRIKDASHV